jgi:hypothetical protein
MPSWPQNLRRRLELVSELEWLPMGAKFCGAGAWQRYLLSDSHPGAHERALRGLLIKVVEGCMGLRGVQGGHPALLPSSHVRQHYRLYEAASWRDQRPMQGSDGVHCLSRRRLITPSGGVGRLPTDTATELICAKQVARKGLVAKVQRRFAAERRLGRDEN